MALIPLADRVVVQTKEVETKTAGGLIIPDNSKEKPLEGIIIAVGRGTKDIEMELTVGVRVLFSKYAGTEVTYEGNDYLIMRQSDIMAIL